MAIPVPQASSEQKVTSNATSTTITAPGGIVDDDVLVITAAMDGAPTAFVWPTDFVEFARVVGPSSRCLAIGAWKPAESEVGDYDVSWTGSQQGIFEMYRIDGADPGNELQNPNESNTGTSALATITPATSTDQNDALVFVVHGIDRDRITEGSGGDADYTTEDIDESGGANGAAIGVQTRGQASQATPPVADLTLDASDEWAAFWFAVRGPVVPPTIDGAVTVPSTIAAGMVEGRVLAGAVSVPSTVAAAMVEGRTLAGAVSIPTTIAAAMVEGRVLAGAVTVPMTVASGMVANIAARISGAVTVPLTIAAAMLEGRILAGAVTVPTTIASALLEGRTLAGAVFVPAVVAAGMVEGRPLAGAVAIPITPASQMVEGRVLAAAVSVLTTIAATMIYTGGAAIVGNVPVLLTIAALLEGPPADEPGSSTASSLASTASLHILESNTAIERALRGWLVDLGGEPRGRGRQSAQRAFADVADFLDGGSSDGLESSRRSAQRIRSHMLTLDPNPFELDLLDAALRMGQDRTEA